MEKNPNLVNTSMNSYDHLHPPSLQQTHQRSGSDESESDSTPKAIPIPLPEAPYGYSRVGNNSWKNLGLIEPVGPNGMRGMLEAAASHDQQIPTRQNDSSSGIKSSGNFLSDKKKPNKKMVPYIVPTRKAPPPPARLAPSSRTATQAPSGDNEITTTTQDANKLKNAKVNRSQLGS